MTGAAYVERVRAVVAREIRWRDHGRPSLQPATVRPVGGRVAPAPRPAAVVAVVVVVAAP